MIPKECVSDNPVTHDLFNQLFTQLGSQYKIVQNLMLPGTILGELKGSLFWVQYQKKTLFLYLSHNNDFDPTHLHKHIEIAELLKLQQKLLPRALRGHGAKLVPFLFVHATLSNQLLNISIQSKGFYILGKELLADKNLGNKINRFLGDVHSQIVHQYIRHIFNPENLMHQNTVLPISQINQNLLDENQEVATKTDIFLNANNDRSANYNLSGLNGGVSSGKSQVLLHRAKLIRKLNPESSLLVLCINEASKKQLATRYKRIAPDDNKSELQTFNDWCKQRLNTSTKLVYEEEVLEVINSLITPRLKENGISYSTFLHELDFIHGRTIFYERDYLKAKQRSQPYHLNESHYPHIWKAVLTLKSELSVRNWMLWSELPQLLWDELQKNAPTDHFDFVMIDDAQDFSPIHFEIVKKILTPNTGQLFITQDPNQGLINPIQLWKDTGLDLRNHSIRLNNVYDINPYILNATNAFYLNRLPDDSDRHILHDIECHEEYQTPEFLHFHSIDDEQTRLINEVKIHIQNDCDLHDILIITANHESSKEIAKLLSDTLKTHTEILNKYNYQTRFQQTGIGICNIMQAQGLKVPYVLVFGLQDIFSSESTLEKGTKEYQELVKENTRKVSMAMTRARKKLTLFMTAETLPEAFVTPHIETPTVNKVSTSEVSYISKLA